VNRRGCCSLLQKKFYTTAVHAFAVVASDADGFECGAVADGPVDADFVIGGVEDVWGEADGVARECWKHLKQRWADRRWKRVVTGNYSLEP
jgi:hypothetical protein